MEAAAPFSVVAQGSSETIWAVMDTLAWPGSLWSLAVTGVGAVWDVA